MWKKKEKERTFPLWSSTRYIIDNERSAKEKAYESTRKFLSKGRKRKMKVRGRRPSRSLAARGSFWNYEMKCVWHVFCPTEPTRPGEKSDHDSSSPSDSFRPPLFTWKNLAGATVCIHHCRRNFLRVNTRFFTSHLFQEKFNFHRIDLNNFNLHLINISRLFALRIFRYAFEEWNKFLLEFHLFDLT